MIYNKTVHMPLRQKAFSSVIKTDPMFLKGKEKECELLSRVQLKPEYCSVWHYKSLELNELIGRLLRNQRAEMSAWLFENELVSLNVEERRS